jgi:4-hydroxy-3-methylbut-2-en-1-yl diphosphate synthase IspG/GcpE
MIVTGLTEVRSVEDEQFLYNLHLGVAEAGKAEVSKAFQAAVNAQLAAF